MTRLAYSPATRREFNNECLGAFGHRDAAIRALNKVMQLVPAHGVTPASAQALMDALAETAGACGAWEDLAARWDRDSMPAETRNGCAHHAAVVAESALALARLVETAPSSDRMGMPALLRSAAAGAGRAAYYFSPVVADDSMHDCRQITGAAGLTAAAAAAAADGGARDASGRTK